MNGFLVRKEPKGYGMKRCVEGPRPDVERPRVVLVDDTMTTGGSTLKAGDRVRDEWGAEIVAAFCIVGRGEAAYYRRYTLITPAGTEREAHYANDSILSLSLPWRIAKARMP